MAGTRIVLIEDHAILRDGLRALLELEPDLQVVGEAGTAAEGTRVARTCNPTLIITDLAMPGGLGLRACTAAVRPSSLTPGEV